MPYRPKRVCVYPWCSKLTYDSYCELHKKRINYDRQRGTAAQRGYDYQWQQARKTYLVANPLCVICRKKGILAPANVVDHITPHRGDKDLFWDSDNWQALCKQCHDFKTATADRG